MTVVELRKQRGIQGSPVGDHRVLTRTYGHLSRKPVYRVNVQAASCRDQTTFNMDAPALCGRDRVSYVLTSVLARTPVYSGHVSRQSRDFHAITHLCQHAGGVKVCTIGAVNHVQALPLLHAIALSDLEVDTG